MTHLAPAVVYLLCFLASAICAVLLCRAYFRSSTRLLFWTLISFICLTLNNALLVADLVFFRQIDLWPLRQLAAILSIATLLYGFIWETEQ